MSETDNVAEAQEDLFDGVVTLLGPYTDPSAGFVYDRVLVSEMSGKEEKLLAAQGIPFRARLEQLLANITAQVIPSTESAIKGATPITGRSEVAYVTQRLLVGDQPWILINARRLGVGKSKFRFTIECPISKCQAETEVEIDLITNLEIRRVENFVETYEVQLPKLNKKCVMGVLRANKEKAMTELSEKMDDQFTAEIFTRMISFDDKPPVFTFLQELSSTDREAIRTAIVKHEPSIIFERRDKCEMCGKKITHFLDLMSPSFFFPNSSLKQK